MRATPQVAGVERPPGVVYAAAVVTWTGATGTAALTVFLTAALLLVAGPVFDAFEGGHENPRWFAVGAGVVVVALSATADIVAFILLRGRRWARALRISDRSRRPVTLRVASFTRLRHLGQRSRVAANRPQRRGITLQG